MSDVTNLIISTNGTEDGERIAEWLEHWYSGVKMEDLTNTPAIGGNKMLEADVRIGAFNYLSIDHFKKSIGGITFNNREDVQIFVMCEGETRFSLLDLEEI